jgi:hypothetical protein
MATGFLSQPFGVMAPSDVPGAGMDAWTRTQGIPPTSALVGGPGDLSDDWHMPYNVDRSRGRIITNDSAGLVGPQGGPGAGLLDDWRDVLNWRHSPAPWLLLAALAVVGLMQFRLQVRAGGRRGVSASAGMG